MTFIENIYQKFKETYNAGNWSEYEIAGGKVALSPSLTEAIVYTDGRYPTILEGYQVNDTITETEKTLWGIAVIELADPFEVVTVKEGDSYSFKPGRPYSISGKCVSYITMDKPWDSKQKH